jgi:hypothetical protein
MAVSALCWKVAKNRLKVSNFQGTATIANVVGNDCVKKAG